MQLATGERIIQGPFDATFFGKEGLAGFGAMKQGKFYLTNRRLVLEGNSGSAGLRFTTGSTSESEDEQTSSLEDNLTLRMRKEISIMLSEVSGVEKTSMFWLMKGINIKGKNIPEHGWRIIFNGKGYLQIANQLITLNKWKGEWPKALKVSRRLGD